MSDVDGGNSWRIESHFISVISVRFDREIWNSIALSIAKLKDEMSTRFSPFSDGRFRCRKEHITFSPFYDCEYNFHLFHILQYITMLISHNWFVF